LQRAHWKIFAAGLTTVITAAAVSISGFAALVPQASGYHQAGKVVLGGEGGWDYLTADPTSHRVFISRGSHVMVADSAGKIVGDIPNTTGVHGIALAPEFNRGFTSNGQANSVTIFDLQTLATIGEAKIPAQGPDGILYDPASKRVFTMDGGSHDAAGVDAKTGGIAGTVALGGRPETASPDGQGHVFVNLEDKSQIVEFDSNSLKILNTWPLAPCESPSGQAIDTAHKRLIIGCHNNMMAFMDYTNGKVVGTVPIGAGVDANAFDPGTGFAFASCGDGTITIAKGDATGNNYAVVETIQTQRGARTMALDISNHNVYTVTAEYGPAPAAPPAGTPPADGARRGGGRAPMLPNTFTLLIYAR
jgi:DNA-binding beta-propeller fold protein YncE